MKFWRRYCVRFVRVFDSVCIYLCIFVHCKSLQLDRTVRVLILWLHLSIVCTAALFVASLV